jgi:hypothetical protein
VKIEAESGNAVDAIIVTTRISIAWPRAVITTSAVIAGPVLHRLWRRHITPPITLPSIPSHADNHIPPGEEFRTTCLAESHPLEVSPLYGKDLLLKTTKIIEQKCTEAVCGAALDEINPRTEQLCRLGWSRWYIVFRSVFAWPLERVAGTLSFALFLLGRYKESLVHLFHLDR